MDIRKARLYAWLSLSTSVVLLSISLLFSFTLFFHSKQDSEGRGVHVISQFFPIDTMEFKSLFSAIPFEGSDDYDVKIKKVVEEMLARYYLEMRLTYFPDFEEMSYRWGWRGPMARLSTTKVHRDFLGGKLEDKIKKKNDEGGKVQTISIQNINLGFNEVSQTPQFQADVLIITLNNNVPSEKNFYVTLDYNYSDSRKVFSKNWVNPYGVYFTRVNITEKTIN